MTPVWTAIPEMPKRRALPGMFYLVRTPMWGYAAAWVDHIDDPERISWWLMGGIHSLCRITDVTHWTEIPNEPRPS